MFQPRILGISPIARSPRGAGSPAGTGLLLGGTVPLSDHEQRLLVKIERALYAEEPKFAHAVRTTDPRVHYKRRIVKAGIGFLLGVCVLVAGLVVGTGPLSLVIGVIGFLVMAMSGLWALQSWKRMT